MKIIPQGYRMLVRLLPVEEFKTEGGLYLPEKHAELTRIGIVEEVGEKVSKDWKKCKLHLTTKHWIVREKVGLMNRDCETVRL